MFIKDLPVINIEEVQSLNQLIQLLIKQNQILGSKCQQNVYTVKDMFKKHEELLAKNRQLQQELTNSKEEISLQHQQAEEVLQHRYQE